MLFRSRPATRPRLIATWLQRTSISYLRGPKGSSCTYLRSGDSAGQNWATDQPRSEAGSWRPPPNIPKASGSSPGLSGDKLDLPKCCRSALELQVDSKAAHPGQQLRVEKVRGSAQRWQKPVGEVAGVAGDSERCWTREGQVLQSATRLFRTKRRPAPSRTPLAPVLSRLIDRRLLTVNSISTLAHLDLNRR